MSSNSNSDAAPIADSSRAALSTDAEYSEMMGPTKTPASATTEGIVIAFVERLVKELNRITDAADRTAARVCLTKFITDCVSETIKATDLESESETSSGSDSDTSRRIQHKVTNLDDKLNKNFVDNVLDLMQGIACDKKLDVICNTIAYMTRLLKKQRRDPGMKPPRKRRAQDEEHGTETGKEHGKTTEKNQMVKKW